MKNSIPKTMGSFVLITVFIACLTLAPTNAAALELIKDGKAVSTIVIPDKATDLEREGAQLLVKYLKMASGVNLAITNESVKVEGTLISLGHTKLAEKARISDKDLKLDGYHLRVKNGVLYLLGRDTDLIKARGTAGAQGSIRAALGLLEKLGFRWLQPVVNGAYVPELKTVAVPDDLAFTHTPPFIYVHGRFINQGNWSMANSFRDAVKVYSEGGHTWNVAVPESLYEKHPEYFRMEGGKRIPPSAEYQSCPSNPDVLRMITEYTLKKFADGYDLVALGQPDGWKPCQCPDCQALGKGAGYDAYEQVHITQNKVIEACYKKYPDRFVHLLIYGPTYTPSKQIKKYPPNTMIEACGGGNEQLDLWKPIIPGGMTVYVYYMGMYHSVALAPKFTPKKASEEIHRLLDHNVKGIYFCGGGENWGAEGPTYYTIGRTVTDPALEWRAILDEYCNLTFRKAGRTMREYYDLLYNRMDAYQPRSTFKSDETADIFTAVYSPQVLDRLANCLSLARQQAADDKRALDFIRLAEMSYNHIALIAKGYHLYQTYSLNPTLDNLKQTGEAVKAYLKFADETIALPKTDPEFYKNYGTLFGMFLAAKTQYGGTLRNNYGTLGSPFTWNFDALIKAGFLPGKDRVKTVFTRLKTAPKMTGDGSDEAWKDAPWVDIKELALGETEASTRARFGYDDKNLYFLFECAEPLIDEMKVTDYPHDGRTYNTECVEVFLAPDGAGQKLVQLCIAPTKDGKWDGRYGYIDDPLDPLALSGQPDIRWNPTYVHAYKIDKEGKKWTVEIAFPFAELGLTAPADGTRWRANFGRERHKGVWDEKKYKNQRELFLWSPNLQGGGFTDPALLGDIYFSNSPEEAKK